MAFPRFYGPPDQPPSWQGRQPKRYFTSNEIGYVVTNPTGAPLDNLGNLIADAIGASPNLSEHPSLPALVAALRNSETARESHLPGTSLLFTPVAVKDDLDLLETIRAINEAFYLPTEAQSSAGPTLRAAFPNWLNGAQQTIGGGTGGSAGLPVPATGLLNSISLTAAAGSAVEQSLNQNKKDHARKINVYVLDTAPNADTADAKRAQFSTKAAGPLVNTLFGTGGAFSDNAVPNDPYGRVLNWNDQFLIYYDQSPAPNDATRLLMDKLVNEDLVDPTEVQTKAKGGFYVPQHDHDMRDHGLFISSLIAQQYITLFSSVTGGNSSPPQITIHLIQVLSNFGVGTLETIARGIAKAVNIQKQTDNVGSAAVINCSWVLTAPSQVDHMSSFIPFPETGLDSVEHYFLNAIAGAKNVVPSGQHFSGYVSFHQGLFAIHEELATIQSQNIAQVIACSGNDAKGLPRPSARLPAAYTSVIGVAALHDRAGAIPSSYSNIADDPANVGYAFWAGDNDPARVVNVEDEPIYFTDPQNSWVGLYFNEFFPDAVGDQNENTAIQLVDLYFTQQSRPIPPDLTSALNPRVRPNAEGIANWTGTSFAAPVMTALFAAGLASHFDPAANTNFPEVQAAIDASSGGVQTFDHEMVIPLQ